MSATIQMRIAHQMNGRIRLVATDTVPSSVLRACSDQVAKIGDVRVEARPASRSLVISHAQPWHALSGALAEAGVIVTPPTPQTPIDQTKSVLAALNDGLGRRTEGRFDLVNIAFIVLVIGGLMQMARGNVAGPAATLFSQALTLALLHGRQTS